MTGFSWSAVGALAVAVVTLTVWAMNYKLESWRQADTARHAAYVGFVASAIRTADRMGVTLTTLRQRSGLNEGLAVMLRWRKPITAMELFDWMASDVAELWEAWVRMQVTGSPGGIETATRAMNVVAVMGDVLAHAGPRRPGEKLVATVVSIDITQAQRDFADLRSQLFDELRMIIALTTDEDDHTPATWLHRRKYRSRASPTELQRLTTQV